MKLKFAIVGCGRIAERHAEQIIATGHELVAVCDIVNEKAASFALKFAAIPYTDLTKMLESESAITVISICSPNFLHASQAILSLKAGKHVLCEKPMAISLENAKMMSDVANASDRKLFIVKQNRYNPPVQAVKKLLDQQRLGKILSFQINCFWNRPECYYENSWRGKKSTDGGTLYTQFSHFIDLLYWFLGDVKSVSAMMQNAMHPNIEFEDSGIIHFRMKNEAIGSMHYNVNSFHQNMEGSITLFGEKGTIKIGGQYLNTLEYQSLEGEKLILPETPTHPNQYGYYQGSMSNHHLLYSEITKALNLQENQLADAIDGMKTVEIIEKIYQNATMAH